MLYFEKQKSPEHVFVVYEEHELNGHISDKNEDDDIQLYTEGEALAEQELYKEYSLKIKHKDHYQENYRVFQNGESTRTEGKTPKQKV